MEQIQLTETLLHFEKASAVDALMLTKVQIRAFNDETVRFQGQAVGGPPGYDSVAWQVHVMKASQYYKIMTGERIVGGLILTRKGALAMELTRIFIDPDYQDRGVGAKALHFMEDLFPYIHHWILNTPAWDPRTHHFYEKMGYRKTGLIPAGRTIGFDLWVYEKKIDPAGSGINWDDNSSAMS